MSKEEILAGNKLISEFMGYKFDYNKPYVLYDPSGDWVFKNWILADFYYKVEGYFKYDSAWDWIMPVVEKVESIDNGRFGFTIDPWGMMIIDYSKPYEENLIASFVNDDKYPKIKQYYDTVIDFIKWYNQQPKIL